MAESSKFTWVQTHKEIVQYLKNMKDRQPELISELEKAGVDNFTDRDASGMTFKLNEMEPFTFFFYIYKYGDHKRLQVLQNLAQSLRFTIPSDADGVPSANAISVRIFPQKDIRTHDEVNRLWALFHKTITHSVTDNDFEDALKIVSVGKAKLTEAFFMVDPEYYLCIDGQTRPYIKEVLGIDPKFNTYSEYMAILQKVREKTDMPFPELSFTAWMWNTQQNQTNYWVFQANPKMYDLIGALREGSVSRWKVNAHRDKIHIGDKVILWATGTDAGCYALAEVTGELDMIAKDEKEKVFYKDESYAQAQPRVEISVTHNLYDRPILRSQIAGIKELANLKVGMQGTNFTATEKQYKALEKLAQESRPDTGSKRYWIYTPGSNGDNWDEFYEQGIMAIGWDELGDLSQFASKEEIELKLRELSGQNEVKKTNDALANWQFKHDVSIGDIIIAKKGQTLLLGYGEVSSDFKYDPDRTEYKKYREVHWQKKGEWEMEPPHLVITKTLTDITGYPTSHPNYTYYQDLALAVMNGEVNDYPPTSKTDPRIDHPLNLILYGPPGTGKTYNTINKAVAIADSISEEELERKYPTRKELTARYRQLVDEGRIVFATFHQSMSYEDFIEGIKPVSRKDGSIAYEVVDGIFKMLCEQASSSARRSPAADKGRYAFNAADGESDLNFEEAYTKLVEDLETMPDPVMKVWTPNGTEFGISLNGNGNLTVHTAPEFRPGVTLTKENLIGHATGGEVPPYDKGYFQGVLSLLAANYGYEAGKQSFPPVQATGTTFPHVLIIDEINRGNVSQIFGELITLIEPDKRSGMKEALEVTLPYSKEKFSVPPNLYIIGTMNTADRSVEALDTALRRRFSFLEMTPDYSLLAGQEEQGIDLASLLKTINQRIEGLLDKDHAIGHSYFLLVANNESSLKAVFFEEIIPLLQEYFYGNFGRIELVLGRGFVKSSPVTQSVFAKPSPDNDEFNDHVLYTLVRRDEMDEAAFQRALRVLMKESDEA